MKELSLNILDIAENSAKANAQLIEILLTEETNTLLLQINDDGVGMDEETLESVTDPFFTTRTTRDVGLGIPLLKLAAEQTGGTFVIESKTATDEDSESGTTVTALFYKNHLDYTPLGDIIASITTLIQGHPDIDFFFKHRKETGTVSLDTRELREALEDVPLDTYDVILWIRNYLIEQYLSI